MISRDQLKVTLLGAAAGFLISEYVIMKRANRIASQMQEEQITRLAYALWAKHKIDQDAARGKYDDYDRADIPAIVKADYDYWMTIAFSNPKAT